MKYYEDSREMSDDEDNVDLDSDVSIENVLKIQSPLCGHSTHIGSSSTSECEKNVKFNFV